MAQQFFDPRIKNNLTVYKLSKKKKKTFNQPLLVWLIPKVKKSFYHVK